MSCARWLVSLVIALAVVGAGARARAEIYKWTDASGQLHFSQDLQQVPQSQRDAAIRRAKTPRKRDPLQVYSSPSSRSARRTSSASSPGSFTAGGARIGRAMRIPFERHGTLMKVDVLLNGRVKAPFYIDTGASGVSIPWAVAHQLGIRIGPETKRIRVRTANGIVAEPVVQLKSVKLGPAQVNDLQAAVSTSMDIGLLGGRFFNNFVYQVDSASSVIVLTPNPRVRGGLDSSQWLQRFEAIRAPLTRLEAYLDKGGFMDESRVRELEAHREELRAALEEVDARANKAGVPQGWRH